MLKNFNPGMIGIRGLDLAQTIAMAKKHGFESVDFSIQEANALAEAQGMDYVKDLFTKAGIKAGSWGFPVRWMDDDVWQDDLALLPKYADLAVELGSTRTATWCPPGSDTRQYADNFDWHVARIRPIAAVLKAHGCSFGFEFIGPQTLRTRWRYTFIHTLDGMLAFAAAVGTGNVGLMLDAFHLYASGGMISDLDTLKAADVVTVHVNDAPKGVAREDQIDGVRCLPGETGVIDLAGFLGKLKAMNYEGPVTTEPFNKPLNDIAAENPDRAAQIVSEHMDKLWNKAGI